MCPWQRPLQSPPLVKRSLASRLPPVTLSVPRPPPQCCLVLTPAVTGSIVSTQLCLEAPGREGTGRAGLQPDLLRTCARMSSPGWPWGQDLILTASLACEEGTGSPFLRGRRVAYTCSRPRASPEALGDSSTEHLGVQAARLSPLCPQRLRKLQGPSPGLVSVPQEAAQPPLLWGWNDPTPGDSWEWEVFNDKTY